MTNVTSNTKTVDGAQTNRELEFIMFGEPVPRLKSLGGFTLLDSRLTQSAGGINNGKQASVIAYDTPF